MHREVVALDTLAKANVKVPQVLDDNTAEYADENAELYFVMEYIPGKTLTDEITNRGRLPLDSAAAVAMDLCKTVADAHKNDVLHRDLKPDNIIVRNFDAADLVIVDYGLSYTEETSQDLTHVDEQFRNRFLSLPETNTPGGDRRDKRSDVTAIAAVLYYCVTGNMPGHLRDGNGHPPHRRPRFAVREVLQDDARCEELDMLFDRAFAVEVEYRFQSCEDFLERLEMTLKPPTPDEDPAVVAADRAKLLRQHDRRTLLAEYGQYAQHVLQKLQQQASTLAQRIKPPFTLHIAGLSVNENTYPQGVDRIGSSGFSLNVGVQSHQDRLRSILFVAGAEGNQCLLLRGMVSQSGSVRRAAQPDPHWEKLLWFNPEQLPKDEQLSIALNQSVTKAIRELSNDILSSGASSPV
jgi:serine/threonine protein kinase